MNLDLINHLDELVMIYLGPYAKHLTPDSERTWPHWPADGLARVWCSVNVHNTHFIMQVRNLDDYHIDSYNTDLRDPDGPAKLQAILAEIPELNLDADTE